MNEHSSKLKDDSQSSKVSISSLRLFSSSN